MIRLFYITKRLKNNKITTNNNEILKKYTEIAKKSKEELLKEYDTKYEKGLTSKEAVERLREEWTKCCS